MSSSKKEQPQELPEDFQPGPTEVVVGRGRKIHDLEGNRRMRKLVRSELAAYHEADKTEKSYILMGILRRLRKESHHAFVKQDLKTGKWVDLPDTLARVTLAQAFRDALSPKYSSSKFSKQRRRRFQKESTGATLERKSVPIPVALPFLQENGAQGHQSFFQKEDNLKYLVSLAYREDFACRNDESSMPSQDVLGCIRAVLGDGDKEEPIETYSIDFLDQMDHIYRQTFHDGEAGTLYCPMYSDVQIATGHTQQEQFHGLSMLGDPFEPIPMDEAFQTDGAFAFPMSNI